MIPSVAACALFAGMGIGLIDRASRRAGDATASLSRSASPFRRPRLAVAAAALLVAAAVVESPPFGGARILDEFTWDAAAGTGRGDVTRCLSAGPRGKVLASMGSLAHFMQELSHEGFDIADFIHEGNGAIWTLAMSTGPAPHAAWMLTEEASEGGDVIARRIRDDPEFVRGMTRICEGGGVALYRRDDPALARKAQNLTPSVP